MGLIHYAYYIRRPNLELALARVFVNGQFDKGRLLSIVEKAAQVSDQLRKSYLEDCGFNSAGWFDGDNIQIVPKMFSASLVEFIEKYHRVENKHQAVMETFLPLLGWEREKIQVLLCGRSFTALAASPEHVRLKREFEKGGQVFSWLGKKDLSDSDNFLSGADRYYHTHRADVEQSLERDQILALYTTTASLAELWEEALSIFRIRLTQALVDNYELLLYNDLWSMKGDRMLLPLK